jgi:hypothetical protein
MTIVGSANFGKSCFGLKKVCNKTSLSNIWKNHLPKIDRIYLS